MDDTAKEQVILIILAEQEGGLTAKQVSKLTAQYQAPVSVRDVSARLQHLMTRRYVVQDLKDPLKWHITPEGIKWAEQNRRKK